MFSAWIHESATDAVKIFNRRAEAVSGLTVATAEDLQVPMERLRFITTLRHLVSSLFQLTGAFVVIGG